MRFSDLRNIFSYSLPAYTVLRNNVRLYQLAVAVTANVTTTAAPAGSIGITSHATGQGLIFFSDGAKWQVSSGAGPLSKASGAEIDTGTDDAKFVTAKAIADSAVSSAVKATGAEIDTGTDDAKFATAKAIADSEVLNSAAAVAGTPVADDLFFYRLDADGTLGSVSLEDLATAIDGILNP